MRDRIRDPMVLTVLLTILPLSGCQPQSLEDLRAEALEAYKEGDFQRSLELYERAQDLVPPDLPHLHFDQASCLIQLGDFDAALSACNTGITKAEYYYGDPDAPEMAPHYYSRGITYDGSGRFEEAIADFERAIALEPNTQGVKNNLAWILSTCPDEAIRDPQRAVQLATEECQRTAWPHPFALDTLAAALAANGDFEQAITIQQRAIELITDDETFAEELQSRLKLYEAGKPFIEPSEPQPTHS